MLARLRGSSANAPGFARSRSASMDGASSRTSPAASRQYFARSAWRAIAATTDAEGEVTFEKFAAVLHALEHNGYCERIRKRGRPSPQAKRPGH